MRRVGEEGFNLFGGLHSTAVGLQGQQCGAMLQRAPAGEGGVVGHQTAGHTGFEQAGGKGDIPAPGHNGWLAGAVALLQPFGHATAVHLVGGECNGSGVEHLHDGSTLAGKGQGGGRCHEVGSAVGETEVVLGVKDAEHRSQGLRQVEKRGELSLPPSMKNKLLRSYLFTWNLVQPVAKKLLIWLAAAIPALMLASSVWAPIFLGVAK